jgi:predicted ATP-grasp superfamily ATP-dependent carboligase
MGRVGIAHGPDEFRELCHDPGMACGALVQEFVPGHGEAIFLLSSQGESVAVFAHRRLRERPPSGGVSVLRESITPDPELLRDSERLLADLGWTGVAMVEYRRAPDGRAVLMEINPRLWGSLQLAIDSGVDFPVLQLALHRREVCQPRVARVGVRTRWLMGDVDHVLIALRKPRELQSLGKSRWGVVREFLAGFFDGSQLEVLRLRDPRPFLRELRIWIGELIPGRAPATGGCEDQEPTCA